jgi:hypothetical protein
LPHSKGANIARVEVRHPTGTPHAPAVEGLDLAGDFLRGVVARLPA